MEMENGRIKGGEKREKERAKERTRLKPLRAEERRVEN